MVARVAAHGEPGESHRTRPECRLPIDRATRARQRKHGRRGEAIGAMGRIAGLDGVIWTEEKPPRGFDLSEALIPGGWS